MKLGGSTYLAFACVAGMVAAILVLPAISSAQRWYAELYDNNRDYVEVTIDLRDIPDAIEDVAFRVMFFNGLNMFGTQLFDFTDDQVPSLQKGLVHRKYFRHEHRSATQARGEILMYTTVRRGAFVGQEPPQEMELARGRLSVPANVKIYGSVP